MSQKQVGKPAGDWFIVLDAGDEDIVIGPYETRNKAHVGRLQYVGNKSLNGDTPYVIQRDPELKAKIDESLPALKAKFLALGKTEEDWEKFYDVCMLRGEKDPEKSASRPAVPAEGPQRPQEARVPVVRAPESYGGPQRKEPVTFEEVTTGPFGTLAVLTVTVILLALLVYGLSQ